MPANFSDLPPEVIEEIFKFLTKTNDRRRVAQVCWKFYKIIRRQSKRNDQLKLFLRDFETTAISVFENSTIFPFSKLYIERKFDLTPDSEFWQQNGMQIIEITLEDGKVNTNRFLATWSAYFPNLRTLRMVKGSLGDVWFDREEASTPNSPDLPLAIKELYIETDRLDLSTIQRLQRAAPLLNRLHLAVGDGRRRRLIPDLLEWIESVEMVTVNAENVSLAAMATDLTLLPSKVIFTVLRVEVDSINGPMIRNEFFEASRFVETLVVEWPFKDEKRALMMELFNLLLKVKLVRNLRVLDATAFSCTHLDLLAQLLPGLETIEMKLTKWGFGSHYFNLLRTTPSMVAKIRSIECNGQNRINFEGLGALTSLTLSSFCNEDLQALSRHCPNLKKLQMPGVEIYNQHLRLIASLSKLEELSFAFTPRGTNWTFETFPKLKQLDVYSQPMIGIGSVTRLAANCPNLERFHASSDSNFGLECRDSFPRLPYLVEVTFTHQCLCTPLKMLTIKSEYFRYTTYYPTYR